MFPPVATAHCPAAIEQSLKEALVDARAGLLVQRNASVVRAELDEELEAARASF